MWLKEINPAMDTCTGSIQTFDLVKEFPGSAEVYIEQTVNGASLVVTIDVTSRTQAPNLSLSEYSEAVSSMIGIQAIVKGVIDTLEYWQNGEPITVATGELKLGSKVIIAIVDDGTGILHIADTNGMFWEPQHADA
jgi:hypothetical protein